MPKAKKFLPLSIQDEWGMETVYIGTPKNHGFSKSFAGLARITEPGTYLIEWPNKTHEKVEVWMEGYVTPVRESGSTYEVSGKRPYVKITHKGATLSLPLTRLGVRVQVPEA